MRKKAQLVLPFVMAKVDYDTMLQHTDKLKVQDILSGVESSSIKYYEVQTCVMCALKKSGIPYNSIM